MMKIFKGVLLIVFLFLLTGYVFADDLQYSNNLLLSAYFKAQALRDTAIENIRKLEKEISENRNAITKAESIISIARGRTDAKAKQAEQIATEALQKARSALIKNEQTLNEWKLKKQRAENSLATIRNLMSEKYGGSERIKGFVSDYSGRVEILKANGETVILNKDIPGFIEPGDKVWTLDGTAEVQMLGGRGSAQIGPYSEIIMKKDTPQAQVAELVKGKVYMAIDKIDDFINKTKEKIEQIKNDETVKNTSSKNASRYLKGTAQLMEAQRHCLNELSSKCVHDYLEGHGYVDGLILLGRQLSMYTPTAVIGVRGTKFAIEVKDNSITELNVLEGSVEVSSLDGRNKVVVNEGYKVIATKKSIEAPGKIINIDNWWAR